MSEVAIDKIFLEDGHLRICAKPIEFADYEFIWRDASSVRWDDATSSLYVLSSVGYEPLREFQRIRLSVLSEYGDLLEITPKTQFTGLTEELIDQLKSQRIQQ